jgi:hypothetical protein
MERVWDLAAVDIEIARQARERVETQAALKHFHIKIYKCQWDGGDLAPFRAYLIQAGADAFQTMNAPPEAIAKVLARIVGAEERKPTSARPVPDDPRGKLAYEGSRLGTDKIVRQGLGPAAPMGRRS